MMHKPASEQLTESLLEPKDVAVRLKISVKSVVRLVKAGTIPARVVVGKFRFFWPEVLASLPLDPASASGRASDPGVVALDVPKRLSLKATHFYRNQQRSTPTQPGGAA